MAEIVREVVPKTSGARDHMRTLTGGRPYKYPLETIERCLWETAANGGSAHRAHQVLKSMELTDEDGELVEIPPARTIRDWVNGPFRNRYQEMLQTSVKEIEELLAQQSTEEALALGYALSEARKQTLAGLANANGVEASTILRNLAQARKMAVDEAGELRRRPFRREQDESLADLARELQQLGIMRVVEGAAAAISQRDEAVDGEAEEVEPPRISDAVEADPADV